MSCMRNVSLHATRSSATKLDATSNAILILILIYLSNTPDGVLAFAYRPPDPPH